MQLASCFECDHPHWSHFHLYSTWVQVQETKVSVDDKMKKQWDAAKDEKEKTEALVATSTAALGDFSDAMDEAMDELARLAEEYAGLSLSGCFSAPLEKAIRLLEQRCRAMEEKGVSPEQLERMRASLEQMKGRLDLLRKAKEKEGPTKEVWKSVLLVTEQVQERARKAFGKVKVDSEVKEAEVKEAEVMVAEVKEARQPGRKSTSLLTPLAWLSDKFTNSAPAT